MPNGLAWFLKNRPNDLAWFSTKTSQLAWPGFCRPGLAWTFLLRGLETGPNQIQARPNGLAWFSPAWPGLDFFSGETKNQAKWPDLAQAKKTRPNKNQARPNKNQARPEHKPGQATWFWRLAWFLVRRARFLKRMTLHPGRAAWFARKPGRTAWPGLCLKLGPMAWPGFQKAWPNGLAWVFTKIRPNGLAWFSSAWPGLDIFSEGIRKPGQKENQARPKKQAAQKPGQAA